MERSAAPPRESGVLVQAVDAGTGAALSDDRLTVRYLVRSPITLDATAVDRVPASEPYRLAHEVSADSLVVEVRLEAPSYHRVDTVFSVPRGATAGPFTVRMARDLGRQAGRARPSSPPPAAQGGRRPSDQGASPTPAGGGASESAGPTDGIDRTALNAGNRAFRREDWSAAKAAYLRMEPPSDRTGAYAREYQEALVRRGISHIRLGEWGGAMEVLEEAVSFDFAGSRAYLLLGESQCTVGLVEAGRQTLGRISGLDAVPDGERPEALAMAEYHRALCSQRTFEDAEGALELLRAGSRTINEFESFLERGEPLAPSSPRVDSAVTDARARIEAIQTRLREVGGR